MNGTMIDFALLVDLAKQTKPETQMMTRINVLEFFGNGSIVEVESSKRQAGEAPSTKLQAPSKESSKRQATSFKHAERATNCRRTLCHIDTRSSGATLCHIDTRATNHGSV